MQPLVLVAFLASFVALWLSFNLRLTTHRWVWVGRLGAALVMGLAISGMHYIGMAAAQFPLGAICRGGVALDNQWLAAAVSIAAFSLLIITLAAVCSIRIWRHARVGTRAGWKKRIRS